MVSDPENQYPTLDAAHPFWESAAPTGVRVGGEWNRDSLPEIEAVLHQLPLGRNAAINAECENDPSNFHGVRPAYALAQRYYTPYNYPLDKIDLATSDLRDVSQPFRPYLYEPVLLRHRFSDPGWRDSVTTDSVQTGVLGNTAVTAAFPTSRDRPGILTYRLDVPQNEPFTGLAVEFHARAFVFKTTDPRVHIRLLAGPSDDPATMTEIARLHDDPDFNRVHHHDLTAVARDRRRVYVRFELVAPTVPPANVDWCALTRVQFTTPWPADLLKDLPPQDESLATVRKQNLVVSWRRDAELALADLAATATTHPTLSSARAAYDQGDYATAYHLCTRALVTQLPATYAVQASGPLDPHAARIDTDSPVEITLTQCDSNGARFTATADRETPFQITLSNLPPGRPFAARQSENTWTIEPVPANSAATLANDHGQATFACRALPLPKPTLPTGTVRGTFHLLSKPTFTLYPDRTDVPIRLTVDDQTLIFRGPTGTDPKPCSLADLRRGDRISADIRPDGTAGRIVAEYLLLTGRLNSFAPTTPYTMPALTLASEPHPRVVDLSAKINRSEGSFLLKSRPFGTVPFPSGQDVTVRCDPTTGRVLEIGSTVPQAD
jgi:hypothetical protein